MVKKFEKILKNLNKNEHLLLDSEGKFSNEDIFNYSLQSSALAGIDFVDVTFKRIDFSGSFFSNITFKNCQFHNIIFGKSEFWNCTFSDCQITNVNLVRAEFNSGAFKHCEFLNSNLAAAIFMDFEFRQTIFERCDLDLILGNDITIWKSDKCIQIKDFSDIEKFLIDNEL